MADISRSPTDALAFIGFGEAAQAFVKGWGHSAAARTRAYDIKTGDPRPDVRGGKWTDYANAGVAGCGSPAEALDGADIVFSTVTADQALVAAEDAAAHIAPATLYFDCNSCSPNTKKRAAALIEAAGGRYVDAAVMAPVYPALHKTPILLSGPHTGPALEAMARLEMNADHVEGPVGASSAIKMVRSIMIKGMEALFVECILAGRRAGVDERVLASLKATFAGSDVKARAAYMMERVMTHGVRRAAEMREVAQFVDELGLPGRMARATVDWQQRVGDLRLKAEGDHTALADALLNALLLKEAAQ